MLALLDADKKKINVGRNLISVKITKQHPPKSCEEDTTSLQVNFGILRLISRSTSYFTSECKCPYVTWGPLARRAR